jgi:hypothetical protein
MPELEQIKMAIALREKEGQVRVKHAQHSADTVRLVTSNLPELSNWSLNGSAPSPQPPQLGFDFDRLAVSGGDIFGPADAAPSTSGKAATIEVTFFPPQYRRCMRLLHAAGSLR